MTTSLELFKEAYLKVLKEETTFDDFEKTYDFNFFKDRIYAYMSEHNMDYKFMYGDHYTRYPYTFDLSDFFETDEYFSKIFKKMLTFYNANYQGFIFKICFRKINPDEDNNSHCLLQLDSFCYIFIDVPSDEPNIDFMFKKKRFINYPTLNHELKHFYDELVEYCNGPSTHTTETFTDREAKEKQSFEHDSVPAEQSAVAEELRLFVKKFYHKLKDLSFNEFCDFIKNNTLFNYENKEYRDNLFQDYMPLLEELYAMIRHSENN